MQMKTPVSLHNFLVHRFDVIRQRMEFFPPRICRPQTNFSIFLISACEQREEISRGIRC